MSNKRDTEDELKITDVTTTGESMVGAAFGGRPEHVYNFEKPSTGERGIATAYDREELGRKVQEGKYKKKN